MIEFQTGKVHSKMTLNDGRECLIRWATWDDLQSLTDYINTIALEDTWVIFGPDDSENLESEAKFLSGALTDGSLGIGSFLVAEISGKIVGTSGVRVETASKSRQKHIASFGVSILSDYRGFGIGNELIKISIDHASSFLSGIKQIILTVYSGNEIAQNLYKKFGFNEYGRLKNGVQKTGKYYDLIYMEKTL